MGAVTLRGAWPESSGAAAQPEPEFTYQDVTQGLADPLSSSLVDHPVSRAIPAFPLSTLLFHYITFSDSFFAFGACEGGGRAVTDMTDMKTLP